MRHLGDSLSRRIARLLGWYLPGGYDQKVLGYNPIAYWPLNELSGTTAVCLTNAAMNGTYSGALLANAAGPDGQPAPWFDGSNDRIDIFSATLAAALNGSQGTAMIWAKVNSVANWTDGANGFVFYFRDIAYANLMAIRKTSGNNILRWQYSAGGTAEGQNLGSLNDTDWMHLLITWDKAGDAMTGYKDGASVVSSGTLGVWGAAIQEAFIGAESGAVNNWHGWLARCAVWDSVLSPAIITDLATT